MSGDASPQRLSMKDMLGHSLDREQHHRDICDERTAGIAIIQMCCGLVNRRAFQERLMRIVHPGDVADVAYGASTQYNTGQVLRIHGPHGLLRDKGRPEPYDVFQCHRSFDQPPTTVRLDSTGLKSFQSWLRRYSRYEYAPEYAEVLWSLEKDIKLVDGILKWAPRHDREIPLE